MGEQRGNDPAAWQYNIPDALGSVRQVVDTQGQVTLARSYDPFGGLLSVSGGAATAYGFAGEEQDPTTGQLYLRARNYNPATGRFLQQDSVIGNPADPRSLHRYAYAFNNPVNYTDPSGHMPPGGGGLLAGNNGSVLGGLSSNNSSVLSNSSPDRSVNGNNGWSGSSNPTPKQQSRGFLPSLLCSGINYLTNAVGLAKNLASFVGNAKAYLNDPGNPIHLRNAVQDLKNANKNMMNMADQFWETAIGAMDIGAQVLIAMSPLDALYDIGSLIIGKDLLTGYQLSKFEKGAILAGLVVGLFTAGIGDDLLQAGGRLSRYGDEIWRFALSKTIFFL